MENGPAPAMKWTVQQRGIAAYVMCDLPPASLGAAPDLSGVGVGCEG